MRLLKDKIEEVRVFRIMRDYTMSDRAEAPGGDSATDPRAP